MSISIASGKSPSTLHVLMGQFKNSNNQYEYVNLNVATAATACKQKYDAFFALVGSHSYVEISNSPYEGDFNRITPADVVMDTVEIDYSQLSSSDKAIIDAAFTALDALS